MSSILEALRELESHQPATRRGRLPPSEPPSRVHGGMETVGLAAIGLVIGALLFVGVTAAWTVLPATWNRVARLVPTARPPVETPAVAMHSAARPSWLEGADPPRARLATAAAERPRSREARTAGSAVEVTALSYSPDPGRRSVALRLDDGEIVSLHEHDSARGVEVQLIDKDGVYVRRGGDVTRLSAPGR